MKYKKFVAFDLERYPKICHECPAFHTSRYQCHNESGVEGHCELGYMDDCDMRDFDGWCLFKKCDIQNNPRVRIMEETFDKNRGNRW